MDILTTLPDFFLFFLSAIVIYGAFIGAYVKATPYNEYDLIFKEGNTSAAIALLLASIAISLPIASIMMSSVSYIEFLVWSGISAAIQLTFAAVIPRVFKKIEELMHEDHLASGILLGSMHLAVGIFNAASMHY